ncbi:MAG: site-specific integrase [Bacteroidia bacterium]|nr:site-specific integrase [Bacteroidia bacterium]
MARVNFYLKDKQAEEETLINLFFSYSGRRLKWYTGKSIIPSRWDFKKQRPKKNAVLTKFLDKLTVKVNEIHTTYLTDEINPTNEQIKQRLNEIYKAQPTDEITVIGLLESFVETNPNNIAPNTLKQYKTLHRHLNEFVEATAYKLGFETIDGRFDEAFNQYLTTKEKPLTPTSINKVYGLLKTFLKYSVKMGYNTNTVFTTFDRRRKKVKQIALQLDEVEALRKLELTGQRELYRDVFLFACETAMEFSALKQLKHSDLKEMTIPDINDGKPVLCADYYRQKNRSSSQTRPIAVLFDEAQRILHKYQDDERESIFPKLYNQVFNRTIKELGKMAGITSTVKRIEYEGANMKEVVYEKYQLISSHTGRRTFATYAPYSDEVKRIFTGHATLKQLEAYKKESIEDRIAKVFQGREEKPKMKVMKSA